MQDIGDVIFGNPPVESLNWVMTLKKAMPVLPQQARGEGEGGREEKGGMPDPVASPPPAIETSSPTVVTEGSPATITVKGFNFVRRLQVYFNARSVPYESVNSAERRVMLDESMLRTPGKSDLVVRIHLPWRCRNRASNTAHLLVNSNTRGDNRRNVWNR